MPRYSFMCRPSSRCSFCWKSSPVSSSSQSACHSSWFSSSAVCASSLTTVRSGAVWGVCDRERKGDQLGQDHTRLAQQQRCSSGARLKPVAHQPTPVWPNQARMSTLQALDRVQTPVRHFHSPNHSLPWAANSSKASSSSRATSLGASLVLSAIMWVFCCARIYVADGLRLQRSLCLSLRLDGPDHFGWEL